MIGIIILTIALILRAEYAFTSFIVWVGSLLFPYNFSWLLSLFVWLVIVILQGIFKQTKN